MNTFDNFHDAVKHLLEDAGNGNNTYTVTPHETIGVDCMLVGDGLAFDFGYIQYNKTTKQYEAYTYI